MIPTFIQVVTFIFVVFIQVGLAVNIYELFRDATSDVHEYIYDWELEDNSDSHSYNQKTQ